MAGFEIWSYFSLGIIFRSWNNGEAIYATTIIKHYNDGNIWFTQSKDTKTVYAIYALPEDENYVPNVIEWSGNIPKNAKVYLLQNNKKMKCKIEKGKVRIFLPDFIDKSESLAFKFEIVQ